MGVALPMARAVSAIAIDQNIHVNKATDSQEHSHPFLLSHVDIFQEDMLRAQQRRHLRRQIDNPHAVFASGCRCRRQQ